MVGQTRYQNTSHLRIRIRQWSLQTIESSHCCRFHTTQVILKEKFVKTKFDKITLIWREKLRESNFPYCSEKVTLAALREDVMEKVIKAVIPAKYIDENTKYHINPCGNFVIGGPMGDAGLTGRKIIVDTYGGWGAHGGGAFSGKDYTKVDRSAAYAARWVAKSLVKAGLCRRCLVQVAYAIGVAEPLSITVMDYSTSNKTQAELTDIVKKNFDLRPGKIVK